MKDEEETLKKTILYRVASLLFTFVVCILLFGSIELSIVFVVVDLVFKTVSYYIYEKLWIRYKRKKKNV